MENDFDMTAEDLERLKNMRDEDIVYDEDCPPTSRVEAAFNIYLMKKYNTRTITKEMIEQGIKDLTA